MNRAYVRTYVGWTLCSQSTYTCIVGMAFFHVHRSKGASFYASSFTSNFHSNCQDEREMEGKTYEWLNEPSLERSSVKIRAALSLEASLSLSLFLCYSVGGGCPLALLTTTYWCHIGWKYAAGQDNTTSGRGWKNPRPALTWLNEREILCMTLFLRVGFGVQYPLSLSFFLLPCEGVVVRLSWLFLSPLCLLSIGAEKEGEKRTPNEK